MGRFQLTARNQVNHCGLMRPKVSRVEPPVVVADSIGVIDLEGKLHLLDPANGSIVGRLDVGGDKGKVAPVVVEDGILVQLLDGRLSRVEVIR